MSNSSDKIDINEIKDPSFLKELSYGGLEALSRQVREQIIVHAAANGGHLSSNLGVVELVISLHRNFDFKNDKLLFDVGHQSYTNKILTGRHLDNLGLKGSVSFFQSRLESPYDVYEAGHSSTSLSAALGFAKARDLKGEKHDVVALIGDSSFANGLAFEGLNNIASSGNKVIIALNDNRMSISPPVGGLSHYLDKLAGGKAPENFFSELGLEYIGPVDGHDFIALDEAINKAKNSDKSVILHIITQKGRGYTYSENDKIGLWHGPDPFDPETGKPLSDHRGEICWAEQMADFSLELMKEHQNSIMLVCGTLIGSNLQPVEEKYKDSGRFIDVGISEEHAFTMAGAMALNGLHPIVDIYSCFLQRSYDELSHDCARFNVDMSVLIDRAGLVGRPGETHQGIYDVAFLKSIPNVTITMPSNAEEAKALYRQSFDHHGVFCIRYPKTYMRRRKNVADVELPYGRFAFLKEDSKDLAIVAVGPSSRALESSLAIEGIHATLINPIYLNKFDPEDIKRLSGFRKIFIYDVTGVYSGFAQSLEAALLEANYRGRIKVKAVPDCFVGHASLQDQFDDLGLSIEKTIAALKEFIRQ
ncbi:MAG: 1-deoxy-D-xylulose-5-phosphate synthase [Bacillota bacterium]|nr:1-deoxy-D-xylulose-5-phosphate synthase [Bacillota bacterium]